ncbi:MBL fold metallo-hydrolase RNA specificity domain-containing protein [Caldovatus aquaticus]|uniref:MBL fold metallo-hydrolase n=1 Tax=Caldovatus aquaticus TaxID=2865671 RepID=A0ABS7F3A1_9PROT|nr:MBL fold metallo-hydrolase [Caldovatus aquaticus]MBW8270090.1 MBL fold metallo-hydrolase [Caldovatus aquaticus]
MAVTLRVCGAARTVTGLCLLFEAPGARFLVDCGMFQGPKSLKALNYEPFPFDPRALDCVLLTHAHIDHSGLLPKLAKAGFRGPIHATRATRDLCSVMLPDAGHVQEMEVETLNRRNRRRGGMEPVTPIYTAEDGERVIGQFRTVELDEWTEPAEGVRARYWNAGHMLGSASIELEFAAPAGAAEAPLRILVSGDLGPDCSVLQSDPQGPAGVDHVICESTYGDEDRPPCSEAERRARLAEIVRKAARRGGALLVPSFAVERAQEVMWDLVTLMDAGEVPEAPVYLDSPLAIRASRIFLRHAGALAEGKALARALRSPRLRFTESQEQSRAIALEDGFHVIIAGSGMCEAGRIRHHLRNWLPDPRATVLFVGFQAEGTLGRLLRDGARDVRIQGERVKVAAQIAEIADYSGHADGPELGRWIAARAPVRGGVFLVHGEEAAIEGLARRIVGRRVVPETAILRPTLDEAFALSPAAPPARLPDRGRRRTDAERLGHLDWHNARAALLLSIERALDEAPDDAAREALIRRLRAAIEGT